MIRKLKKSDKEQFFQMEREFYTSPAVLHTVPEENFEITFKHIMDKSPFVDCWVYQDGQKLAGYILLALTHSNEAGGTCVWIEEIYVRDSYQGHGIGAGFILFLKQHYPQAKRFRLEFEKANVRAKSLYERLGFKDIGYEQMALDF